MTLEGGGLVNLAARRRPARLHRPGVALVRRPQRQPRRSDSSALLVRVTDAGDGAGTWQVELAPQSATTGASLDAAAGARPSRPAARHDARRRRARGAPTRPPARTTASSCCDGRRHAPDPVRLLRRDGRSSALQPRRSSTRVPARATRVDGPNRVSTSTAARLRRSARRPTTSARRWTRTAPRRSTSTHVERAGRRTSASRSIAASRGALDRPVAPRLGGRERRAGLRRHAGQRERRSCSTTSVDVGAAGASFPRPKRYYVSVDSRRATTFTDAAARRPVRAALVGERRHAAVAPARDDARRRRAPDDRRRVTTRRRRRSRASTRCRS